MIITIAGDFKIFPIFRQQHPFILYHPCRRQRQCPHGQHRFFPQRIFHDFVEVHVLCTKDSHSREYQRFLTVP